MKKRINILFFSGASSIFFALGFFFVSVNLWFKENKTNGEVYALSKEIATEKKKEYSGFSLDLAESEAIILDRKDVLKFDKLKEFQRIIHQRLLNSQLKIPKVLKEIEIYMKENDRVPEYWKTTLPTIFNPRGPFVPSYDGLWLEFGVKAGGSIVYPAFLHSKKVIHGFDSFEGLPESDFASKTPWKRGSHRVGISDPRIVTLQNSLPNIILHKGWFKDTCSEFLQGVNDSISFVHIDGDLYESASDVLKCILNFNDKIQEGCVIVFDNFVWLNEETSFVKNHEVRALYEFLRKASFKAKIIGRVRHSAAFSLHRFKKFEVRCVF